MAEGSNGKSVMDVILLGKTGMGKSTTGNKLIGANGNNAKDQALEGILSRSWCPVDDHHHVDRRDEVLPLSFDASEGTNSATKGCAVITNKATGFRVMDTRGFAPSDVRTDVYLANLRIVREVVSVSTALGLKFQRVLYFMPEREIPNRADAYLQEELAVLWHFFGNVVFQNMVIVVTVAPRNKTQKTNFVDEFGEPAKKRLKSIFMDALKNAIKTREDAALPCCPTIVFIPPTASNIAVAEIVRNAEVCEPTGINLVFRKTTCCKCASVIYIKRQQDRASIVGVEEEYESIKCPEESHCHPVLIPKHSRVVKIVGTVVHIALLGVVRAYEFWQEERVIPSYFGKTDEKCENCGSAPNIKGCIKVGHMYGELKVVHEHEQKTLKVVDE